MIQYANGAIAARVVRAPELRFTPGGHALASFTVASSQRHKDAAGDWKDSESTFIRVTVWRNLAEHVAETDLRPGDSVVIAGDLHLREWEDKEGITRRDLEMTARSVSVELSRVSVVLRRTDREKASPASDPWADPVNTSALGGDAPPPF